LAVERPFIKNAKRYVAGFQTRKGEGKRGPHVSNAYAGSADRVVGELCAKRKKIFSWAGGAKKRRRG